MQLRKLPAERTPQEIHAIKLLLDTLPYFDKFDAATKEQLARVVWYECHGAGRQLLRAGDEARAFYYIVTGSVMVYPSARPDQLPQPPRKMGRNEVFGDLGIRRPVGRRTASVIIDDPCEFLCVNSHDYAEVLEAVHALERRDTLAALRGNSFFASWTESELVDALSSVQRREYRKGALICNGIHRPHMAVDEVYVLLSGACRYLRRLPHPALPGTGFLATTSRDMAVGTVFTHAPQLAVIVHHKSVVLHVAHIVFLRHDRGESLAVRKA